MLVRDFAGVVTFCFLYHKFVWVAPALVYAMMSTCLEHTLCRIQRTHCIQRNTYLNIPGPHKKMHPNLFAFPFFHREPHLNPTPPGPLGALEVPLLNALDCWMSYCIMILVAGSALYLEPINKVGRETWVS